MSSADAEAVGIDASAEADTDKTDELDGQADELADAVEADAVDVCDGIDTRADADTEGDSVDRADCVGDAVDDAEARGDAVRVAVGVAAEFGAQQRAQATRTASARGAAAPRAVMVMVR